MIVVMALVINLLTSPAFSLLPLLVKNHFEGGAIELAWLQSASGIGMILGGILLGVWGGFRSRINTAMFTMSIGGVCLLIFGLLPSNVLLVGVGLLFFFGMMNSITNASFMALLQSTVPADIQGRVFTLMMSLIMSMTPIGLALAGPISDILGVRIWYPVAGAVMTVMSLWTRIVPAVRQIEEESPNRLL